MEECTELQILQLQSKKIRAKKAELQLRKIHLEEELIIEKLRLLRELERDTPLLLINAEKIQSLQRNLFSKQKTFLQQEDLQKPSSVEEFQKDTIRNIVDSKFTMLEIAFHMQKKTLGAIKANLCRKEAELVREEAIAILEKDKNVLKKIVLFRKH